MIQLTEITSERDSKGLMRCFSSNYPHAVFKSQYFTFLSLQPIRRQGAGLNLRRIRVRLQVVQPGTESAVWAESPSLRYLKVRCHVVILLKCRCCLNRNMNVCCLSCSSIRKSQSAALCEAGAPRTDLRQTAAAGEMGHTGTKYYY